jgi:dolichyl-phosphate-mannose-protein mannosyltransferase
VSPARVFRNSGARTAAVIGLAAAFVVAVDLARWIGPWLLLDPDRSWALPRIALGLAVFAAAAAAGVLAASAFRAFLRSDLAAQPLEPLPLSRRALAVVAAAALVVGIAARAVCIGTLPFPFLEDEVNLVTPALALTGAPHDFADAIFPIPLGRPDPHEMIGVAYLELLRASLHVFGTTITGLRFPSLLAGCLSLLTAGLLGRALLPEGGGMAAILVLAGLRWHAILSLSGWHAILIAPVVDLATLLLLRARRRSQWGAAVASGAVMGIGPHFYLASWAAAAALAAFAVWPPAPAPRRRLLAFLAGFALTVAPLFVFAQGRRVPYFGRSSRHNLLREIRYQKSLLPAFSVVADALPAPWLIHEPQARHDLTDRSRLGTIVGALLAVGLARALARPREELSALLLLHAGTAGAAAVAGGTAGHPNGFRFGYLTSPAALAAAAGLLAVVGLFPQKRRRAAAIALLGLVAVSGTVGLRDAIGVWPFRRATFDSFRGEDTLLGQTAARWGRYGEVRVEAGLGRSDLTIETVNRYALDPDAPAGPSDVSVPPRFFQLRARGTSPSPGQRLVESVRDSWGREWAVVLGSRGTAP